MRALTISAEDGVYPEVAIGSVNRNRLEALVAPGLTPDEAVDVIIMGLLR